MNEEKFFKELGISSDDFLKDAVCVNDDRKLLLSSKDMLIALIDSIRFFFILMDNIKELKKNDLEFYNYVQNIYNEKRKIVEKATGKTRIEIIKIWEDCQDE